ncbi:hypothetical protein NDU88_007129 [Pleurodeles waltl]|uniref:Uncharacterized protein n=1 Tax=Pleurodeles waltl TaxID=8319 RepID=A0AAV7RP75_PLEWA|nr:hypothetical protein NDU88_007129 [Pleurodeles waltl]
MRCPPRTDGGAWALSAFLNNNPERGTGGVRVSGRLTATGHSVVQPSPPTGDPWARKRDKSPTIQPQPDTRTNA